MEEPTSLDERINAIVRKHQFEPIRDPELTKKQIEDAVWVELRQAIARGEVEVKPGHEMKVQVRVGPPELGPPIELKIELELKKPKPEAPTR